MWLDLLPVKKSYFPHLGEYGINMVLDLRYDPTRESMHNLRNAFHALLKQISLHDNQWLFSFVGSLVDGQNLSLLNFISVHQFETAFDLFEVYKLDTKAPMPMCEISFLCSLDLLEEFMKNPSLNFGWDFRLGGWLVKTETKGKSLKEAKFPGKFYFPPTGAEIGFCFSEDWDCVQFFSADENKITNIQKLWTKISKAE